MTSIDWKLIDDYEFVHLTADVLRKMGFVDLLVQGTGPDGGLDLIATELVPFAIQGQQPFKWGIQCKFSKSGTRTSVNDSEIRDVMGILASDRYSTHDLQGYMVVTNRKIVQNVLERLRGINRTSAFRTACLDGHELRHRLADHPQIVEKYFGEAKTVVRDLGPPRVTGTLSDSGYIVDVQVKSPTENLPLTIKAALDTGSDLSVLPKSVENQLGTLTSSYVAIQYATGETKQIRVASVDTRFEDGPWLNLRMWIANSDIAILGQDFLKHFTILFDATKGVAKLWPKDV